MLFRDNTRHLRDILEAIDLIELFVHDMTFESYQTDLKTKSAVERQMQIMTEAAIRLAGDAERIAPGPGLGRLPRDGEPPATRLSPD